MATPQKKMKTDKYNLKTGKWSDLKDNASRDTLVTPIKSKNDKNAVLKQVTMGKLGHLNATSEDTAVTARRLFEDDNFAGPAFVYSAHAADPFKSYKETFLAKQVKNPGSGIAVVHQAQGQTGAALDNLYYLSQQSSSSKMPTSVVSAKTNLTDHSNQGTIKMPSAALITNIDTFDTFAAQVNDRSPGHAGSQQKFANVGFIGPGGSGKSHILAMLLKAIAHIQSLDREDQDVKAFIKDKPHEDYTETSTHFISLKSRTQFNLGNVTEYGQLTRQEMVKKTALHDNVLGKFATPIYLCMDDPNFTPAPFTCVEGDHAADYVGALQSSLNGTLHQPVIEDADTPDGALGSQKFQKLFSIGGQRDKGPVTMCAHKCSDWTQYQKLSEWNMGFWWHVLSGDHSADLDAIGIDMNGNKIGANSIAEAMVSKFEKSSAEWEAAKSESDYGKKQALQAEAKARGQQALVLYSNFIKTRDSHDAVYMDLSDNATMPAHAFGSWDSNFFCLKRVVCEDDVASMEELVGTTGGTRILDYIASKSPEGLPLFRTEQDKQEAAARTAAAEAAMLVRAVRTLPVMDYGL
jgi:hypothetical protein